MRTQVYSRIVWDFPLEYVIVLNLIQCVKFQLTSQPSLIEVGLFVIWWTIRDLGVTQVWLTFHQNKVWAGAQILEEDFGPAVGCLHWWNSSQCTSSFNRGTVYSYKIHILVSPWPSQWAFSTYYYRGAMGPLRAQTDRGPCDVLLYSWCFCIFLFYLALSWGSMVCILMFSCERPWWPPRQKTS